MKLLKDADITDLTPPHSSRLSALGVKQVEKRKRNTPPIIPSTEDTDSQLLEPVVVYCFD